MVVTVNGESRELPDDATVASLIAELDAHPQGRGLAVALAGEVVPRAQWPATRLRAGDRLEVLAAIQGG